MRTIILNAILCGAMVAAVHAESGRFLKAGEIMPGGWMKEQIRLDLAEGYLAQYDRMNHTVTNELFVHKDRVSTEKYDRLRCWWSGEHEGYWKDGVLRMAFLSGNEELKKEAVEWLDAIVAAQDEDGYIGIYKAGDEPNSRFRHEGENGEIWAQSRIFQAFVAGYEFTGNGNYLAALKKAVDCAIANDPGNYFDPKNEASGGVSHGVGFFDTLWYLYNETGEQKYADYAVKLFADFNDSPVRDDDLKTDKLLGDDKFQKHGAHVAEGFFVPAFIASIAEDEKLDRASDRALEKLKYHLTPSGAMVCSERVNKRPGSGKVGYEYCSIAELVQSLTKVAAISGNPAAAEIAESMTFNAGQGARLPVLTALAYVSEDNRIDALTKGKNDRHAYAAFHNAAACCTLNGGRLLPYYIEGMWTREKQSLTAQLYGPCTVNTEVNGVALRLKEETAYPFEDEIRFEVSPAKPMPLKLRFRIPKEAADVKVSGVDGISKEDGYVVIDRTWKQGDSFTLTFDFPVKKLQEVADTKETYFKCGPLVYALPIEHDMKLADNQKGITPESGFHRYEITAKNKTGWTYRLPKNAEFKRVREKGDLLHPFANTPTKLKGTMLTESGVPVETTLVPIGCTVLRRTTFPEALER